MSTHSTTAKFDEVARLMLELSRVPGRHITARQVLELVNRLDIERQLGEDETLALGNVTE